MNDDATTRLNRLAGELMRSAHVGIDPRGFRIAAKDVEPIAEAIAAVIASAPAGDGVPVAWMYEKKSSVSDLVRRIVNADRDNYAVGKGWTETPLYAALARPHSAGASAGDGVEFAARVLWADGQMRLGQSISDLPRTRTDFRDRARKLLAEHPALARPRAAVGDDALVEHLAIAMYCADNGMDSDANSAHIHYWFRDPDEKDKGAVDEYRVMARAAILALQSPPAKVEG